MNAGPALSEAVRAGMLIQVGEQYRFLHDRVREAAYSLIAEEERAAVHLQIGRLLVASLGPELVEERVFDEPAEPRRPAGHRARRGGDALPAEPAGRPEGPGGDRLRLGAQLPAAGGCVPAGDARALGLWDPSRLDQVLENLLANAVKFGASKPIRITVTQQDGRTRLAINDHGIGVDPAQQARIFERFGRAVSEEHYGGLGLGLYICRRIVEAHEGTITVASTAGAGATFTVELPNGGGRRESGKGERWCGGGQTTLTSGTDEPRADPSSRIEPYVGHGGSRVSKLTTSNAPFIRTLSVSSFACCLPP